MKFRPYSPYGDAGFNLIIMAKKKVFRPIEFAVEIGTGKGKKVKKLEIWRPGVNIPGFGKFAAEDLMKKGNEAALAKLVEIGSGVIRPVTEQASSDEEQASGEDVIETLNAEVSEKDTKISELNTDIAERDGKIETMDDEIVSLKSKIESSDSIIKNLEDRIAELNDDPKKGGK